MALSLNSVQLIGNLTRDPELRYTPTGRAVCTIGLATNRSWTTEAGEKKEEVEFHRIVVWAKLAELCSQLLTKGSKAYFHGRLTTRTWTAQDGTQKTTTEIIADDMIVCSSKKPFNAEGMNQTVRPEGTYTAESHQTAPSTQPVNPQQATVSSNAATTHQPKQQQRDASSSTEEDVSPDDIPF